MADFIAPISIVVLDVLGRDDQRHSMRHAFASRMIDRGISSTVLAALMGHESSTITERRYIHLFDRQRTDDAVRQAMAL